MVATVVTTVVEVVTATVAGGDDATVEADRRGPSATAGADGGLHGSFADLFGAEESSRRMRHLLRPPAIPSAATLQDQAIGTMTGSPGHQSVGVATPKLSAVCSALIKRISSAKLRLSRHECGSSW
jgi:hypothetical protein